MKLFYLSVFSGSFLFASPIIGCAQSSGIVSGDIYVIESKAGKRVLDVRNASLDEGAVVDCGIPTGSDAQRWMVQRVGGGSYTLTNVASGKLLHLASDQGDSLVVDQRFDTGAPAFRWLIKRAVKGYYYIRPEAAQGLSLSIDPGDAQDGARTELSKSSEHKGQQWSIERVPPQDVAPTLAIADKTFDAWYTLCHVETHKGFWDRAEMMEILLDGYEVTKEARYITRFNRMYDNFIKDNKADWMYNNYNDDITWAVLFCVRAYLLTGNKAYLTEGKSQFDKMYARALTNSYGGGLIWYETKTSKNACINGPAMVACCYLAKATGDSTYYDKAIALYTWSKLYLFDSATGKVNDNVDVNREGKFRVSRWSSTYNQGTYLGAAVMLYQHTHESAYLADAEKIARYTRDSMYQSHVINNEDGGNDLPGFKGIFARYARKYTMECHKTDLVPWLLLNAKVAYNNRNSSGLIQTKWGTRTKEGKPRSDFGASTAVSLLINTLLMQPHH